MDRSENECFGTIANLINACQTILEVYDQYGYPKDPEFLKGVSFLAWYLNAEIDFRRRVGEAKSEGKEMRT